MTTKLPSPLSIAPVQTSRPIIPSTSYKTMIYAQLETQQVEPSPPIEDQNSPPLKIRTVYKRPSKDNGIFEHSKTNQCLLEKSCGMQLASPANSTKKDRSNSLRGGVAIRIHKNIRYEAIPLPDHEIEYTTAKISNPIPLIIVVAYNRPKKRIDLSSIKKLTTLEPSAQFIIGEDFNPKREIWNNVKNNSNGITLWKFLDKNLLNVLFPNSPTHIQGKSKSVIDIFLSNISIATKIENYKSTPQKPRPLYFIGKNLASSGISYPSKSIPLTYLGKTR
ncbi:LOW QUALITY PROTEIN: RNA-directed DNA polymerase from mobile element jockey-like [Vespula squamosa]|uniref:RNA-directed DNA polymerase from mobile element jockey-like n=1 Tax=Vespula squamosa TaxID=30214 RepID=A0ABD2BD31_VESSQ